MVFMFATKKNQKKNNCRKSEGSLNYPTCEPLSRKSMVIGCGENVFISLTSLLHTFQQWYYYYISDSISSRDSIINILIINVFPHFLRAYVAVSVGKQKKITRRSPKYLLLLSQ